MPSVQPARDRLYSPMRLVFASDHAGYALKQALLQSWRAQPDTHKQVLQRQQSQIIIN